MDEASYNGPSADEIAQKTASEVSEEGMPAYLTIDLAIIALVAICLIIGIYIIIKKQ